MISLAISQIPAWITGIALYGYLEEYAKQENLLRETELYSGVSRRDILDYVEQTPYTLQEACNIIKYYRRPV